MWTYKQNTGQLFDALGNVIGTGYAGRGGGKNNPAQQFVHDVGPLPQGNYTICAPQNHPESVGAYALALIPDKDNNMGEPPRGGFFIHGDSIHHPGQASDGCIVLDYGARVAVWVSNDHCLSVEA